MKILAFASAIALMACSHGAQAAPVLDLKQFLSKQGWHAVAGATTVSTPAPDIAPVFYHAKDSSVPSCGLVANSAAGPIYIDILSPEAGETYPHCAGIKEVARFTMAGKNHLVVEYFNRDSRSETYRQFFYVARDHSGAYVPDATLNEAGTHSVPVKDMGSAGKPSTIGEGIRLARAEQLKKAYPSLTFLQRDFIGDARAAFAVLFNPKSQTCIFVVDAGGTPVTSRQDHFYEGEKCAEFLASAKLESKGKTYFLGMFANAAKKRALVVFSVAPDNAITVEKEFARQVSSSGAVNDIKSARQLLSKAL